MISLDSNVVIDIINGHPAVRERFRRAKQTGAGLCVCALVFEELRFGAEICRTPEQEHAFLDEVLQGVAVEPFDAADAVFASKARGKLERMGMRIGQIDALIAGQALSRGWTLATANTRHFVRIEGLALTDWRQPAATEQSHI